MERTHADGDEVDEVTHSVMITPSPFQPIQLMESLLEKLKLLNFENSFCKFRKIKGISKLYFALPTNTAEQFNTFVSLSSWLINQSGMNIETPQEFDDPNAIVANILNALRSIVKHSVDFPPSKLKSGSGEYCIRVLDLLAEAAIKHKRIQFEHPQVEEKFEDDNNSEQTTLSKSDSGEIVELMKGEAFISKSSPEILPDSEIEDETGDDLTITENSQLKTSSIISKPIQNNEISHAEESTYIDTHGPFNSLLSGSSRNRINFISKNVPDLPKIGIGSEDWYMEVERAIPQLHLATRSNATATDGWRVHLEQIGKHRKAIGILSKESRAHLKRLEEELTRDLDKINSREKYINAQIGDSLEEYRRAQDRLAEVKEAYVKASSVVSERSASLSLLTDEVKRVKTEMEERGSSMTDSTPVVRIKQAIQRLKTENVAMAIRIGVLEHSLLRAEFQAREKSQKPIFGESII